MTQGLCYCVIRLVPYWTLLVFYDRGGEHFLTGIIIYETLDDARRSKDFILCLLLVYFYNQLLLVPHMYCIVHQSQSDVLLLIVLAFSFYPVQRSFEIQIPTSQTCNVLLNHFFTQDEQESCWDFWLLLQLGSICDSLH